MTEERRIDDLAIKGTKAESEQPKQLVEKLPEDILKIMEELRVKKGQLVNQYLNVSFQVEGLRKAQSMIYDKIGANENTYNQKIEYAFNKLKLKKKKNYRWSFNGKDSFVGNLVSEPKK